MFAQHLPSFGWEPTVLTVHEDYYEENLDWNLVELLSPRLQIEKVKAFKVTSPRLIGDIGLRAFFQLYKKASQLIFSEKFDFLYITIPSFYSALLGRRLHSSTGIRYGIDYIDPWVHQFPGSNRLFSRHWFSTQLAKFLEPIAIKKASLITGVAEGYYKTVLERNPHLKKQVVYGAMPYGGEGQDHDAVSRLGVEPYLFPHKGDKIQFVYAGAMLPKAYKPLESMFAAIAVNLQQFLNVEFHFIGTGSRANDNESYNIKRLAQKYGLWQTIIYEYPKRIPYLDVLVHLDIADAVFILGSTESHYTPSKTYQGVLSKKPLMAILHKESTAVKVIGDSRSGLVLDFDGEEEVELIERNFVNFFENFLQFFSIFKPSQVDLNVFEQYSAKNVTRQLAKLLDSAMENNG